MNNQEQINQEMFFNNGPAVKNAAYYRGIARAKLKKFYWTVFAVLLVAGLLGGVVNSVSFSPSIELPSESEMPMPDVSVGSAEAEELNWENLKSAILEATGMTGAELKAIFAVVIFVVIVMILAAVALTLFVGSPVALGFQKFLLNVMDEENVKLDVLFSYFKTGLYGKAVILRLLHSLVMTAASLPGVLLAMGGAGSIAAGFLLMGNPLLLGIGALMLLGAVPLAFLPTVFSLRYYYAATILAEYPEMSPVDAMKNSAQIMKGNKCRLFCLQLSFIGWLFLGALALGVGVMFVTPYLHTAMIAFYDDITNRTAAKTTEFPSIDPDDYILGTSSNRF